MGERHQVLKTGNEEGRYIAINRDEGRKRA